MSMPRAFFSTALVVVIALGALSCSETSTPTEPTPAMATVTINLKLEGGCPLSAVRITVDSGLSIDALGVPSVTFMVPGGHHTFSMVYTTATTPPQMFQGFSGSFDVAAGASTSLAVAGNLLCPAP